MKETERGGDIARRLQELEEICGYRFSDKSLLFQAMCHSSYVFETNKGALASNERLEFLGDAVLELASSEIIYDRYPEMPEGEMTRLRASLVCEPTLAMDARDIGLGRFLILGKGEEQGGGSEKDSIVSDALEALIGAVFKDGGFARAKEFVSRFVMNDIEKKRLFSDSKTLLQERLQGRESEKITYEIIRDSGPDHNKYFEARVLCGSRVLGEGGGRSKKAAEQQAAYQALCSLDREKQEEPECI